MSADDEQLEFVFIPSLASILIHAEDLKGAPLTHDEVVRIRGKSTCIALRAHVAREMDEKRGYRDINPENFWYEWQQLRREMGRKPDLDPGPKFNPVRSSDPEFQQTIEEARASLEEFRRFLPADGGPRWDSLVKTKVKDGEHKAFLWLCNTRKQGDGFVAELFEVPAEFSHYKIGDELEISADALLDWMVNDRGVLFGGFSIRYQRARLPEDERAAYDEYMGVTRYA